MTAGAEGPAFPDIGFPELAETHILKIQTGVPVTGAAATGDAIAAGFGDGSLRLFRPDSDPVVVQAHDGAVLCLQAGEDVVVTGGDDGRFVGVSPDGTVEEIANFGTRWVDCVAVRGALRACSSGRVVHLWTGPEKSARTFEHPSTVAGLAFDAEGRRLAVAHYGGVTVWQNEGSEWIARKLAWNGPHAAVTFSPDGRFLIAALQENMLNCWRLEDQDVTQLYGSVVKVKSFAWIGDQPFLATSGAYAAICWPFDGAEGPKDREPRRVCTAGELVTAVLPVAGRSAVIAGFRHGAVIYGDLDPSSEPVFIEESSTSAVTALAVTQSKSHILIGHEDGTVIWKPLKI
ncbi:MAG: WD40 repeat domain-containing protein [Pseudomonadota bacterium]